jgi:Tfp pilus assembly protein PilX
MKIMQIRPDSEFGANATRRDRGVALIFTLLILSLLMILSVGMVIAVNSQTFIAGFYKNYRSAFYAADSGANITRHYMLNQLLGTIPSTFTTGTTSPIPTTAASTVQTNTLSTYGAWSSLNAGDGAQSWPERFEVTSASFALASGTQPTLTYTGTVITNYAYTYNYSFTVLGEENSNAQSSVTDGGSIVVNVGVTAAQPATISFAYYGGFINSYTPCLGALIPGTMTGPMYANGAWQFESGNYIFTDPVTQTNADLDYWFGGSCIQSPNTSYKSGNTTIAPDFEAGVQLGVPAVSLPTNSYNQEWAALDGVGTNSSNPTTAQMEAYLTNTNGGAAYASGATSGVYMSYHDVDGTLTMQGGGIYVQGAATVELSTATGSSPGNDPQQVITITQNSTTTTITLDNTASTTSVKVGTGATTTIHGVPEVYSWSNSTSSTNDESPSTDSKIASTPATMIYVNGNATLTGPGQGVAAIQNNYEMTLTANGNVTATGDVLYATEPVTTTQNQIISGSSPACCNGDAVDTLIPQYANMTQVLGIFTATGNFDLNNSQSNGNIEVDGSIATISQGGTGGFYNTGKAINTFNNVGGQIQNNIYSAAITTENVYFDRRFTHDQGFAPPWFPSTTVTPAGVSGSSVSYSIQRVLWQNTNATLN